MPIEISLVRALRALLEIAGAALAVRAVLHLLLGARRERNPMYRILRALTAPLLKLARKLAPRIVLDRHLPLLAFAFLLWLWILLLIVKRYLCSLHGLAC